MTPSFENRHSPDALMFRGNPPRLMGFGKLTVPTRRVDRPAGCPPAYARADNWDERARMMAWGADRCDEMPSGSGSRRVS